MRSSTAIRSPGAIPAARSAAASRCTRPTSADHVVSVPAKPTATAFGRSAARASTTAAKSRAPVACVTLRIVAGREPPGRVTRTVPWRYPEFPLATLPFSPCRLSGDPMTTPLPPTSNMRASLRRAKAGGERFLGGMMAGATSRRLQVRAFADEWAAANIVARARRRAALGRARRFHEPGDRGHHARGGLRRRGARGAAPPRRLARDQPVAGGRGRRRRAGPPAAPSSPSSPTRSPPRSSRASSARRTSRAACRAPTSRCARCAPPCRAAR